MSIKSTDYLAITEKVRTARRELFQASCKLRRAGCGEWRDVYDMRNRVRELYIRLTNNFFTLQRGEQEAERRAFEAKEKAQKEAAKALLLNQSIRYKLIRMEWNGKEVLAYTDNPQAMPIPYPNAWSLATKIADLQSRGIDTRDFENASLHIICEGGTCKSQTLV